MHFRIGAYALGAILVTEPVHAQTSLTAADIQQALGGKRISLSCVDGTSGSGRYIMAKNFGTITGTYQRPGEAPAQDVGRVRAEGNQLCLRFKKLNNGDESCFGVSQRSPGKYAFTVAGGLVSACQVSAS